MTDLIHRLIDSDANCFVGDYYDPTHRTDEIYTCLDCLDAGIRAAERERIIALLQQALDSHTKVLQLRPIRPDSDHRHTICRTYQAAIALIKGENK